MFSYAIGSRKLSANEQFFVGAQTVYIITATTSKTQNVIVITVKNNNNNDHTSRRGSDGSKRFHTILHTHLIYLDNEDSNAQTPTHFPSSPSLCTVRKEGGKGSEGSGEVGSGWELCPRWLYPDNKVSKHGA